MKWDKTQELSFNVKATVKKLLLTSYLGWHGTLCGSVVS